MPTLSGFTIIDFILVLLFTGIGFSFIFIGADKLYKIYFGIIIGFLIFLILNAQIENLEIIYPKSLTGFQNFLVKNKDVVLGGMTCFIPIFGVFMVLNNSVTLKEKPRLFTLVTTGTFLPLVILGIFSYILKNSYVKLKFLSDILSIFSDSYIFFLLRENSYLVFLSIMVLIFYNIIFSLFVYMITRFSKDVIGSIRDKYYNRN